ncbi:soluble calcium-activated nucleotidase 1-like [Armigeres subalbatus]|uniref:soluble calcium-activated nucleotidase 1-like n=1 Tax=Armigeres subalbatus TaxID=124917 RepID=UPI002ED6B685
MKKYNYSKLNQRDLEAITPGCSTGGGIINSNGSTVIDTGMYLRDWRQALRTPPSYRIGNRTIRLQVHIIWPVVVLGAIVLFLVYIIGSSTISSAPSIVSLNKNSVIFYNTTYPLSSPIVSNGINSYRIGVIADLDTNSRVSGKDSWNSYYMKGYLSYIPSKGTVTVSWDETGPTEIKSSFSLKGKNKILFSVINVTKLEHFIDSPGHKSVCPTCHAHLCSE